MNTLTIYYDPHCGLCAGFRRWLETQALWVAVEFVGFDSPEAERRFPGLTDMGADREVVVQADDGSWWQGADAWVVCLWATREYRLWSHRLATPFFKPWLRAVVHGISSNRLRISALFGMKSEAAMQAELSRFDDCENGACHLPALKKVKQERQLS
jgi:predicted DCC family thiol-disulfide oxidoreductase YuxK